MANGVTITLGLHFKPEFVDAFCGSIQEMLKDTASFAGFQKIVIVRNKEDANRVLFIENWASEEAYGAYIAWRTERGDMDNMAAALAEPPVLSIWPTVIAQA